MTSNESTKQQTAADQEEQEVTPVAEMTAAEVESEGEELARLYLRRRGYVVGDGGFTCEEGGVPTLYLSQLSTATLLKRSGQTIPE